MAEPISCLIEHPNKQSILFGGVYINLTQLAREQHIDRSYLSRIINGRRDPGQMSVRQVLKFAAALGMSVDDFLDAIYDRANRLARDRAQVQVWHDYREAQAKADDTRRAHKGLPPVPRIF